MNGAHDLGGMMGFGPVVLEPNEPVFHAPWEARLFSLVLAAGEHGRWTLDELDELVPLTLAEGLVNPAPART